MSPAARRRSWRIAFACRCVHPQGTAENSGTHVHSAMPRQPDDVSVRCGSNRARQNGTVCGRPSHSGRLPLRSALDPRSGSWPLHDRRRREPPSKSGIGGIAPTITYRFLKRFWSRRRSRCRYSFFQSVGLIKRFIRSGMISAHSSAAPGPCIAASSRSAPTISRHATSSRPTRESLTMRCTADASVARTTSRASR